MIEQQDSTLARAQERAETLRRAVAEAAASVAKLKEQMRRDIAELRRTERSILAWQEVPGERQAIVGRPKNPDRRQVADRALEIIRSFGRPLARKELFEQLAERGTRIEGKDPEMVLGTMLYRDDRIVRIRGYGYWPKSDSYDPAFYLPEHEGVIGVTEQDTV
jgi:uncharacterized coiled-coil protein SlyX